MEIHIETDLERHRKRHTAREKETDINRQRRWKR
jgi:hypothetical protein